MAARGPDGRFTKGNAVSVRHGAHAKPPAQSVRQWEDRIYDALAAAAPVKEGDELPRADEVAVRLLARTLCRLESVSAWLDERGPLDGKGKPRSAANWERRLTATASKQLAALGMTPQSRAKLGVNLKRIDLATALSEPDVTKRATLMGEAGLDAD
jgi:hypothetical protein